MGSEAPPACTFYLTGFGKFHGVADNPTEVIVGRLKEYVKCCGMPPGATLGSCTILHTAGVGAVQNLMHLLDSVLEEQERIIWVHLGVNSGATKFALERKAVNEATFRCPDEMGWQPQRVPIVTQDGPLSTCRETCLPVDDIVKFLGKKGFDVTSSDDAGRFVCNYVYYHSLRHAQAHSRSSLFVHVPLFSVIDEDTQMKFVLALLNGLVAML